MGDRTLRSTTPTRTDSTATRVGSMRAMAEAAARSASRRHSSAIREKASSRALRGSGILTGAHSHLALVGSRTGALDDAFSRIAEECRVEADRSAASAIALIEPSLVAVLSVLVGIVLLSVLAPMLGILSAM